METNIAFEELINDIKEFYNKLSGDAALDKVRSKYLRGIQVLYSPLIFKPDFLFLGINPGIGYYEFYKKDVHRFNPLQNFEYNHYNYTLARETKKVFKMAGLSSQLKNSMKSNCFFFSTKNEKDLHRFLSHLKALSVYSKSRNWIDKLVALVQPKFIICEGKSAFEEFLHDKKSEVDFNDGIYYSFYQNIHVIGYSRRMSFIKNKENLAALIKSKYK